MDEPRQLAGPALAAALRDSRARSIAWALDLTDAQWHDVPQRPGLNPPAWELAHLCWFAEFWTLRGPHRLDGSVPATASSQPLHAGPDALLDSARMPHADRWRFALPNRAAIKQMLAAQLEDTLAALEGIQLHADAAAAVPGDASDAALYFHRLALFHEDMHSEAFAWLRATVSYPAPTGVVLPQLPDLPALDMPSARHQAGWPAATRGFAFDNELPAREVATAAFEIDATPVTAGSFLAFVEAGGYDDARWWPGAAGRWRTAHALPHPTRWRRAPSATAGGKEGAAGHSQPPDLHGTGWLHRWFDRWLPLDLLQPVIHISAWEAEAWCRWAGRRLPRAAEWERAALAFPQAGSSVSASASAPANVFHWGGSVWEWTADDFLPHPGFAPGPYREYSAPWFGPSHRELRGGAFATHARMHHPRYRNFFAPGRIDVFAGFRSAAAYN